MKISKVLKRGIALTLAVITCLSIAACKSCNDSPDSSSDSENNPVATGKYIVKPDGTSDYAILMPKEKDEKLNIAVSELQLGIELCTGYTMSATTDYVEGRKYLSIGDTALYQDNKTVVDGDGLEYSELRVVTADENVIMMGGSTESVAYAAYEFMEASFGFKWYTFEDYYIEESDSIELLNFNLTEKPKLEFRCLFQYDYMDNDDETRRNLRMRTHGWYDSFILQGHNMIGVIMPKELYGEAHPEWYSRPNKVTEKPAAGQLCVTNEECLAEFIERTKQLILENWDNGSKSYFMIGMEDNWEVCTCPTCMEQSKINGGHSGNYIIFVNKVSRAINEWVKTIIPNKTIYFPMYAYFYTIDAPVVETDNREYVPANENVIPDKEVLILYAPLKNPFTYSFDDERNDITYKALTKWEATTNGNLLVYSYSFNESSNAFYPFNDLITMGGSIGRALKNGYFGWLEESVTRDHDTNMPALRNYVRAQLWWGTDKSVDELAWEFIDYFYRPVAEEFKAYYSDLKQWLTYLVEEKPNYNEKGEVVSRGIKVEVGGVSYSDAENWPINVIDHLDGQLEAMIEKLEPLKKLDLDKYQMYFDRVNMERLWTSYAYCNSYKKYLQKEEFLALIDFIDKYSREYYVLSRENLYSTLESWRNS